MGLLGLKVSELHGALSQEQRLQNVKNFKSLEVPVLICTDLAARGLDIPKIELVINYDMPKTFEIYLHRVGRTARAGRDGISISFVGESSQERAIVKSAIKTGKVSPEPSTGPRPKKLTRPSNPKNQSLMKCCKRKRSQRVASCRNGVEQSQ